MLFRGAVDATMVHPVFFLGLRLLTNASSIIIALNHQAAAYF